MHTSESLAIFHHSVEFLTILLSVEISNAPPSETENFIATDSFSSKSFLLIMQGKRRQRKTFLERTWKVMHNWRLFHINSFRPAKRSDHIKNKIITVIWVESPNEFTYKMHFSHKYAPLSILMEHLFWYDFAQNLLKKATRENRFNWIHQTKNHT